MNRINVRNYAMVAHISGARGAGSHDTAYSYYERGRNEYLPDIDYFTEEEMRQEIIRTISAREAAGIRVHFVSNFAHIGRRSDILPCLDSLVKDGRIWRTKKLSCRECGTEVITKGLLQNNACLSCDMGVLILKSESYGS